MKSLIRRGVTATLFTCMLLVEYGLTPASASASGGITLTCIDFDRDGYGVGPGCKGPDADDADPRVNTVASWKAKYRTIDALLAKRGYTGILRYWFIDYAKGNDATCVAGASAVSEANPCATLEKIRRALRPGDAVVLRGGRTPPGTTFIPITSGGTATNPILMIGYPGELFVMDRTGQGVRDGISGSRVSYITLDGFKIVGGKLGNAMIFAYPHHVTVRNMETDGNYTALRMFQDLQDVLIERNVFHDNKATENVYLGSRGMPNKNVIFRQNIIYNASGPGSGYPAVQHNGRVTNYVVESNTVYGAEQCFSFLQGVSNSVFRNNLCFGNAKASLTIYNYPGNQQPNCTCSTNAVCPYDQRDNVIENNTFVRSKYDRSGTENSQVAPIVVRNKSYCALGDLGHNVFRNNIVYGYGDYPLVQYYDTAELAKKYIATSTWENNVWFKHDASNPNVIFRVGNPLVGAATDYTSERFAPLAKKFTGNIVADPQFKSYSDANWSSPSNNDFHLKSTSPAIKAGAAFGPK